MVLELEELAVKIFFSVKQIIEKRRAMIVETHMAFIDYEKAFGRLCTRRLWDISIRRGFPPVSYTHLDVYKRQLRTSSFHWLSHIQNKE